MKIDDKIIKEWTNRHVNIGECLTRRIGETFEVKYNLPLEKTINYKLPTLREIFKEFYTDEFIIVSEDRAICWIEEFMGRKVQQHSYMYIITIKTNAL